MESEHHPYAMTITMLVLICVIVTLIRPIQVHFTLHQRRIAFTLDYALTPVLAVLVLLLSTAMTPSQVARGMLGDDKLQPYAIIILFFSLAYTCIALDVTGLFDYLALRTVQATRGSGTRLFSYFFLFSAALTILTSNDIVILTLTPIIAALASYAKIDPTPALFGQFFAANILSLELFIGYSVWMASVGIFAGIICFALLMLVFRHEIPITFRVPVVSTEGVIKDKFGAIYDSIVLGTCLVLLSTSSWSHLPIWAITLTSAGLILVRDLARDYQHYRDKRRFTVVIGNDAESPSPPSSAAGSQTELVGHVLTPAGTAPPTGHVPLEATIGESDHVTEAQHVSESDSDRSFALATNQVHDSITRVVALRLPWKIVPFVIGVFIIVEGLYDAGWTNLIATGLRHAVMHDNDKVSILIAVLLVSFSSTLACNVLNNQPMTILYTRILLDPAFYGQVSSRAQLGAMLALVLGSNLGANLTLIGALAGIMWSSILSDKGYPMTYFKFAKYGFMITPIVTACASLLLAVQIMFFPAINV